MTRLNARPLRTALLAAALVALALKAGAAPTAAPRARCVLLLHSYSRAVPWGALVGEGFDASMAALPKDGRPRYFEESLDTTRLGEPGLTSAWASWLEDKYRNADLGVVIAESQQATTLILAHPGLFPGAERYLFNYAISSSLPAGRGDEQRFSSPSNLAKAVLAVKLILPQVSRIVAVVDRSSLGVARAEELRSIAAANAGLYSLDIWDDFTGPELLERARSLPKTAAIFYLPVQYDRERRPLMPAALATDLAAAASVPVFTHFDALLGTGVVGGYMVSGRLLGGLMGRIAAGERAPGSQEEYAKSTMGYYFDDRALARWRIGAARLPAGSAILYREKSALARYWPHATVIALVFLLETALVTALARALSQRGRAMALLDAERSTLERRVRERTSELESSAAEKGILLHELQHRVKNSMTIIASLAMIEADDAVAGRPALERLGSRISALGALYDILFETGGVQSIELDEYLRRVVVSAASSLGADARGIAVECDLAAASFDVRRAVPLGLIVNELVTDCVKHAFEGRKAGRIRIVLAREGERLSLAISDDGVGLSPGFDAESHSGLALVALLARQVGAVLSVGNGPGGGASFGLSVPLTTPT
jgi:two-component sensor histidine kinase